MNPFKLIVFACYHLIRKGLSIYLLRSFVLFFIFSSVFLFPVRGLDKQDSLIGIFDQANAAYVEMDYQEAKEKYLQLLQADVISDEVHYNLGNCYFKTNQIPLAILHYEKALKINPSHQDAAFNLKLANQKTIDKIESAPELFIYRWWKSIYKLFHLDQWAKLSVLFLLLALFGLVAYLYFSLDQIRFKKLGFYTFSVSILLALLSVLFAFQQNRQLKSTTHAIVSKPSVNILSAPSVGSSQLFVLHEGTKVKVEDQMNHWVEIALPNGNKGWVDQSNLSMI